MLVLLLQLKFSAMKMVYCTLYVYYIMVAFKLHTAQSLGTVVVRSNIPDKETFFSSGGSLFFIYIYFLHLCLFGFPGTKRMQQGERTDTAGPVFMQILGIRVQFQRSFWHKILFALNLLRPPLITDAG